MPNSLMKSKQKSVEFSFLLFTVTSTALPCDFCFFKLTQPLMYFFNLFHMFSKSCNLLHISTIKLLYTEQEKGGKPDRKPYPLLNGLRNPYRNLKSENPQCPETSTKLYFHEFGFCDQWSHFLSSYASYRHAASPLAIPLPACRYVDKHILHRHCLCEKPKRDTALKA